MAVCLVQVTWKADGCERPAGILHQALRDVCAIVALARQLLIIRFRHRKLRCSRMVQGAPMLKSVADSDS